MNMETIKKPLIYFLIQMVWLIICIGLAQNIEYIGAILIYFIISGIIHTISFYHIVFPNDKAIKDKEPELYAEVENKVRQIKVLQIPLHGPEANAASWLIFNDGTKKYPSIRPQIIEYLSYMVFNLLQVFLVFSILIFSLFNKVI